MESMMTTYKPLARFLETATTQAVPMTFAEIEAIIGRKLPPSAYKHRPWWSNNTRNSAMTRAWVEAGWQSEQVDMERRRLVFRRTTEPGKPAPSKPEKTGSGNGSITIHGLTPETMNSLMARAQLLNLTIAQAAGQVLEQHARLGIQERLTLADRIRSESPRLHHVDVVQSIRDDRDSR
jgi:hypothetical protein